MRFGYSRDNTVPKRETKPPREVKLEQDNYAIVTGVVQGPRRLSAVRLPAIRRQTVQYGRRRSHGQHAAPGQRTANPFGQPVV